MAKIQRVFFNVDMRNSHDGLSNIAKKEKVDVNSLDHGEFVMFLNSEQNRLKLYGSDQIIAYLRVPSGRINLETLQLIPKAFLGKGRIDYDRSLKEIFNEKLKLIGA